ncbi:MAG: hypothetical protein ACOY45_00155 [Pseudomonadota bacterium]
MTRDGALLRKVALAAALMSLLAAPAAILGRIGWLMPVPWSVQLSLCIALGLGGIFLLPREVFPQPDEFHDLPVSMPEVQATGPFVEMRRPAALARPWGLIALALAVTAATTGNLLALALWLFGMMVLRLAAWNDDAVAATVERRLGLEPRRWGNRRREEALH